LGALVYASPMASDNVVVGLGGYHMAALGVRAGGSGDVTQTRRLWHLPRTKLWLGTGVIRDKHIYINDMEGVVQCLELATAKVVWQERLRGPTGKTSTWSSLVLAGDRIYMLNQDADCFVFKAEPKFELLATNSLGEYTNSSIAVSNGDLFIRTHEHLWCIGARA